MLPIFCLFSRSVSFDLANRADVWIVAYCCVICPTMKEKTGLQEPPLVAPKRTVMDSFNKTSWFEKEPEVGFGTGSRPPLYIPSGGPGPGAYPIRTTLGKLHESHIRSPCQYTLRSRTKFGDPNERSMSKSNANEPG